MSRPETTIVELESHDFAELEEALGAWDHQYCQISQGAFYGRFLHTQTGSLGVYRNRWERAIHYRGAPKGTIMIAISLVQTGEARWMGQRAAVDDMIVQPSGVESDYLSAPLWDSVVFTIPEAELARQIVNITHEDPDDLLRTHGVVHLTPQLAAHVRQAALNYIDAALRSVATPDAPSPLPQMASVMVEMVARALVNSKSPRHPRQSVSRRFQLIRKAEDYCAQTTDQPLRIGQLCHELRVSERTFRDAFHNLAGISPLAYLKTQRLNRAYRELRAADPTKARVKQVCYANGFLHPGQFSRDYMRLFGESPSETLLR
jgi:AraC family ethanolamine operon transcriptional activator